MKNLVTALATAAVAACFATPASAQNVGGRYQVIGKNFNGSPYSGTAEITVTSRNTCRIVWVTGSTTSSGICMRNANAFSAGYVLNGKVGLVIYEMKPTDRSTVFGPSPIRPASAPSGSCRCA